MSFWQTPKLRKRVVNFQFNLPLTGLTLILLPILIGLGIWQLHRADTKKQLEQQWQYWAQMRPLSFASIIDKMQAGGDINFMPLALYGYYDSQHQFLLDNRTHNGQAGYQVLTPFIVRNDTEDKPQVFMVNRGWVALGKNREQLPDIGVTEARQMISGKLYWAEEAFVLQQDIQHSRWPRLIQALDRDYMQNALNQPIFAWVLQLDPELPHGFVREWKLGAGLKHQTHLGYAVQWFSLALALLILYAAATLRIKSPKIKE